jgi:hypothetical protein
MLSAMRLTYSLRSRSPCAVVASTLAKLGLRHVDSSRQTLDAHRRFYGTVTGFYPREANLNCTRHERRVAERFA